MYEDFAYTEKNRIYRNSMFSFGHPQRRYLFIDEGPYMLSLEHLVEHYMRFSDGLPIKLRYPVPPKPKPPLPLFSTIPKSQNRGRTIAASPPRANAMDDPTNPHSERKISLDSYNTTVANRSQRNMSIPSDDLMNQVGILSTSPIRDADHVAASPPDSGSKKKSTSDILNFRSLKFPKKYNIKDGMKSLKKSKSPKDSAKSPPSAAAAETLTHHNEEISQSLRNLTFSTDFVVNESAYNVPTNNSIVADKVAATTAANNDNGNVTATTTLTNAVTSPALLVTAMPATADMPSGEDYFTQADVDFPDTDTNDTHDRNNIVEEIYFVDAPTKLAPPTTQSYTPFVQRPYFPDVPSISVTHQSDHANNNNNSINSHVGAIISRLSSTSSNASNESELIMSLQQGVCDESRTYNGQAIGPLYYIPKESIVLEEILGDGEFGSVHKGTMKYEHEGDSTVIPVAIKTLHDEHCKENRKEFLREARVMIKLSHHCIVKLLGISKVSVTRNTNLCTPKLMRAFTFTHRVLR